MVQQFEMDDVPAGEGALNGARERKHGLAVVCDEGGAAEERGAAPVSRTPVRSFEAGECLSSSPFDSDLLMRKLKRAAEGRRGSKAPEAADDGLSSPLDSFLLSSKHARFLAHD